MRAKHAPYALIALLLIAAAGGCAATRKADRAAFDDGYAAFQAGQWQRAVDQFTLYLRSDPTSPSRGEVYYYRGQAQVHLSRRKEAKEDFTRALGAKAASPIDLYTRVALGNLYYEEGDDRRAIEQYSQVCGSKAKDLPLDQVCLRLAVSLQRLGKWTVADRYLQHLLDNYLESAAAQEAARRLHARHFMIQTGAFSSVTTANGQVARLRAGGFVPRVVKVGSGGRTLYAVQTGVHNTYAQAEAAAGTLREAGFSALIVP